MILNESCLNVKVGSLALEDGISIIDADAKYFNRVIGHFISTKLYFIMKQSVKHLGVTESFKQIIDEFGIPQGETPAGFRVEFELCANGVCRADLKRDISYDKNGVKRPTKFLFSADSANPYEVMEIKNTIANLTCNPAIIYNLFINNPKANIGGKFQTRDEVMSEIGRILGPGIDISVELNDPFNSTQEQILEECDHFAKMLSKHRVVIKVPHTGPINSENISELLSGDKRFHRRWNAGSTADRMRGHNLAIMLKEHGYRVNFTLMFEPFQTAMALQASPYFINSFIMFREQQTKYLSGLMNAYESTGELGFVNSMREFMLANDYLGANEAEIDGLSVLKEAENILRNRLADPANDGLDAIRHNLRALRRTNLPDTRLIVCNFQDERLYPQIDRLIMEDEFLDMADKIVITNPPELMSAFTSSPLVVQFQRRFMNAVNNGK
ncbi:MAG: transaldolase family protein [Oscillospiraceae bacterium]